MTRTMYDGIASDATVIPSGAQLVAGYVDGEFAWSAADWDRFPHSIHVGIAVHPSTDAGIVLDCEPGNCTPPQAVDWVLMRRAAGADPSVYCNQSNPSTGWPAVRLAFQARGVREPHYWVANYDGNPSIPAGAVAKQYESTDNWDLSVVADYWPGVDPVPVPPSPAPPPPVPLEDSMYLISVTPDPTGAAGNNSAGIFAVHEGLGPVHVDLPTYDDQAFMAKFGPVFVVSTAYYDALVAARPGVVTVDPAAVAAALAPLLPAPPTTAAIATAVATQFSNDLKTQA